MDVTTYNQIKLFSTIIITVLMTLIIALRALYPLNLYRIMNLVILLLVVLAINFIIDNEYYISIDF